MLVIDIDQGVDPSDLVHLCIKATHYQVVRHPNPGGREVFSTIRGIIFDGARYEDHVAACDCGDGELTFYKFADYGYTKCERHGFQGIGQLRRESVVRKKK
jgi:hypothetical protein